MKKNGSKPDENLWRYKELIDSWMDFINDSLHIEHESLKEQVTCLVRESYDLGFSDASAFVEMIKGEILN